MLDIVVLSNCVFHAIYTICTLYGGNKLKHLFKTFTLLFTAILLTFSALTSCSGDLHDAEVPKKLYIIGDLTGNSWDHGVLMSKSGDQFSVDVDLKAGANCKFINVEQPGPSWANVGQQFSNGGGNFGLGNAMAGLCTVKFNPKTNKASCTPYTTGLDTTATIPSKVYLYGGIKDGSNCYVELKNTTEAPLTYEGTWIGQVGRWSEPVGYVRCTILSCLESDLYTGDAIWANASLRLGSGQDDPENDKTLCSGSPSYQTLKTANLCLAGDEKHNKSYKLKEGGNFVVKGILIGATYKIIVNLNRNERKVSFIKQDVVPGHASGDNTPDGKKYTITAVPNWWGNDNAASFVWIWSNSTDGQWVQGYFTRQAGSDVSETANESTVNFYTDTSFKYCILARHYAGTTIDGVPEDWSSVIVDSSSGDNRYQGLPIQSKDLNMTGKDTVAFDRADWDYKNNPPPTPTPDAPATPSDKVENIEITISDVPAWWGDKDDDGTSDIKTFIWAWAPAPADKSTMYKGEFSDGKITFTAPSNTVGAVVFRVKASVQDSLLTGKTTEKGNTLPSDFWDNEAKYIYNRSNSNVTINAGQGTMGGANNVREANNK